MSVITDLLDAAVEISTTSAEIVATKWQAIAVTVLALVVFITIAILLLVAPMVGLALAGLVIAVVYLQDDGGGLV